MVDHPQEMQSDDQGSRPVPDPTVLTTQAVDRAMRDENRWVESQIAILLERLDGMDKANELRLQRLDHFPSLVDEKINAAVALTSEKFTSIHQQFAERDIRGEREARDNKVAVDAAFAAQKEAAAKQDEGNQKAIDKSEKATTESISKLAELFATSNQAIQDKITEVGRRVDRIEALAIGTNAGTTQSRESQQAARTLTFAILTVLLGIIAIGASILAATGN